MSNKILVVDDENAIRTFLVRALENEGYVVQSARSGEEALQLLANTPFDLLLTDIRMEHMDGVALLEQVRGRFPSVVVILLTGYATVGSAIAALRQGAQNYLLKPVKNEEILAAVASGLQEQLREQRRDLLERVANQMTEIIHPNDLLSTTQQETVSCRGLTLN